MTTLQKQASQWAATQGHRSPPAAKPALRIETMNCTCPSCGKTFAAESLPGITRQGGWLYCSPECQLSSHPELRKASRQIKLASLEERERARSEQRSAEWRTICPARYQRYDPALLKPVARAMAAQTLAWTPGMGGYGLGLCGASEAGKSYLAHELARLLHSAGHDVHLCYLPSLVVALKGECGIEERAAMVRRCKAAEVLLIDDIGMESDTVSTLASFYEILDVREREERANIYTCNKSDSEMRQIFPAPLYNRLTRTAEWRGV